MSFLIIEIIVLFSFLMISMLMREGALNRTVLACFVVSWAFFYDYFNYHAHNYLNQELYSIKLFFEVLVVTAFLIVMIRGKVKRTDATIMMLLGFTVACTFVIGAANDFSLRMIYVDFRSIFLPLLLCLLFAITGFFEDIDSQVVVRWGIFLLLINGALSVWDYLEFDGNYEDLWRYQSLLQSKAALYRDHFNEDQLVYQLVRDGQLRSSGFLVSALTASYLYAFVAIYFLFRITQIRLSSLAVDLLVFLMFLFFIYVTKVRAGYVMVVFALIMFCVYGVLVKKELKYLAVFLFPLCAFLLLSFYLLYGGGFGIDASSLGRIAQYEVLVDRFKIIGSGLGSFPGMFDSLYIYKLLELGVFSLLVFYVLYKTILDDIRVARYLDLIYVQFSVFLFLATFQHIAGSAYYFFFIFYLMLFRYGFKEKMFNSENDLGSEGKIG